MNQSKFKHKRRRKPGNSQAPNASKPRHQAHRGGGGGNRGRSRRPASSLNPDMLVKKAQPVEVKNYVSDRLIADLPVDEQLKRSLMKKGFERPTQIQDQTLEILLSGRDLLGIAQTGTGKTAAFLVPIIQQLIERPQKPYALVLVPTRELANQVEEEFRSMTKGLNLYSACFIGGTNLNRDLQNLRRSSHVVIATPGRLLDLVQRKAIDLRQFHTLVLDEFDRMLDMGFIHDVKRILNGMQQRNQTMLFSATLDKTQESLIREILHNHATIKVSAGTSTSDNIDQDIIRLNEGEDKFNVLCQLISNEEFQKVLLFEETKHKVAKLCKKLNSAGISSDQIHGNKSQGARQSALKAFKLGKVRVLVATDVAARGIDVNDVTHVINYQMPMTMDSYIHRIGRTGRAGKIGKALTFVA